MSEVNKIANYNQMMSWLTRPSTPQTETRENFAKAGFAKATTAKKLKAAFVMNQERLDEYLSQL